MTFKVTVLGSSAALPMAGKHHSAHVLNVHEQFYLTDCGEGTQARLNECGINPLKIKAVFITHLHGDHLYGLFPLLSTLSLMGRRTPLKVFAPHPLGELMECVAKYLNSDPGYEVDYHPVDTRKHEMVYENSVMQVWSVPLRHRIPASGFLFREKAPKLNVHKEMIDRYGLSIAQIVAAKRGEDIIMDEGNTGRASGRVTLRTGDAVPNSCLTYRPYASRSYAYCADTLHSGRVAGLVEGVDLLYHEATFAAADRALAKATGHSTTVQAARVALKAGVGHLLIGHFSGRYKDTAALVEEARTVFPNTDEACECRTYEIEARVPAPETPVKTH